MIYSCGKLLNSLVKQRQTTAAEAVKLVTSQGTIVSMTNGPTVT